MFRFRKAEVFVQHCLCKISGLQKVQPFWNCFVCADDFFLFYLTQKDSNWSYLQPCVGNTWIWNFFLRNLLLAWEFGKLKWENFQIFLKTSFSTKNYFVFWTKQNLLELDIFGTQIWKRDFFLKFANLKQNF